MEPPHDRPDPVPKAHLCTQAPDNAFLVSLCIPELQSRLVAALIDSGASDNFIDRSLVDNDPRLIPLSPPISLTLFDGQQTSAGQLTHAFHHSVIFPTGESRSIVSYVTTLHPSAKLVLGLSWLTAENPHIDFATRTLTLTQGMASLADEEVGDAVDPMNEPPVDTSNTDEPGLEPDT